MPPRGAPQGLPRGGRGGPRAGLQGGRTPAGDLSAGSTAGVRPSLPWVAFLSTRGGSAEQGDGSPHENSLQAATRPEGRWGGQESGTYQS